MTSRTGRSLFSEIFHPNQVLVSISPGRPNLLNVVSARGADAYIGVTIFSRKRERELTNTNQIELFVQPPSVSLTCDVSIPDSEELVHKNLNFCEALKTACFSKNVQLSKHAFKRCIDVRYH